jgi:hypothetical protein
LNETGDIPVYNSAQAINPSAQSNPFTCTQPVPKSLSNLNLPEIGVLLRGEAAAVRSWTDQWDARRAALHLAVILLGAGMYGAAMGSWRAPQQALFVAVKLPLIILLTTAGNVLLNAMLAPLLGLNLTFRQTLLALLMSCAVTAAILGAFAPISAFLVWNTPKMSPEAMHSFAYGVMKLAHVAVIAFAGCAGNARLFQLLVQLGGRRAVAARVLFAWLAGNLFLGSQLCWILRPFIGAPNLAVEFLRSHIALQGNFYENLFHTVRDLLSD